MKKKALITATAVLLVAVMCLATASYAWFTSATTNSIEKFEINITATDGALELAAADMKNNNSAGTYRPTLNKADWSEGWAIMNETFTAVSTATAAAGTFFPAPYSAENRTWTSEAAVADGYLYFSFWVKASEAGTATFKLDTAKTSQNETFGEVVKYAVGTSDNATPGEMAIYDITADETDSYQPMNAVGATCEKVGDYFVPVDGATGFANARTQGTSEGTDITFTAAGTKLVTVAVWLEGMDKDCTGTWQMTGEDLQFGISWTTQA